MKEKDIQIGISGLIKRALDLGRKLRDDGVIAPKGEPIMTDQQWADKKAKEFIDSLE